MIQKIKIAVLGAGHLGKIHLKILNESSYFDLVGFYDPNKEMALSVSQTHGYKRFESLEELISETEIVDVVTPTLSHYECAKRAIESNKHVFIEKPIANNSEEAMELIKILKKYNLKGQVGHVERFNPAFKSVREAISNPMFFEIHRLAEFNPRGTDVPVVLDLMIHDIDIVLSLVKANVKKIDATGVSVISKSPDIANARIEFENGCVANLTASRISMKNMRSMRVFQKDAYIKIDFLKKNAEIITMKDVSPHPSDYDIIFKNAEGNKKQIYFDHPEIKTNNAIKDELESFATAIISDSTPEVTFEQATQALKIGQDIVSKLNYTL